MHTQWATRSGDGSGSGIGSGSGGARTRKFSAGTKCVYKNSDTAALR